MLCLYTTISPFTLSILFYVFVKNYIGIQLKILIVILLIRC